MSFALADGENDGKGDNDGDGDGANDSFAYMFEPLAVMFIVVNSFSSSGRPEAITVAPHFCVAAV